MGKEWRRNRTFYSINWNENNCICFCIKSDISLNQSRPCNTRSALKELSYWAFIFYHPHGRPSDAQWVRVLARFGAWMSAGRVSFISWPVKATGRHTLSRAQGSRSGSLALGRVQITLSSAASFHTEKCARNSPTTAIAV